MAFQQIAEDLRFGFGQAGGGEGDLGVRLKASNP